MSLSSIYVRDVDDVASVFMNVPKGSVLTFVRHKTWDPMPEGSRDSLIWICGYDHGSVDGRIVYHGEYFIYVGIISVSAVSFVGDSHKAVLILDRGRLRKWYPHSNPCAVDIVSLGV